MRGQTILDSDGNAERIKGWSVFFYFVGVLCYAANTLYKESYLHTRLVDVWFLSVTVSAINFCVTFAIIPLLWIPGMGLDTPSTTFPHLWAGVKCVFLGRSDMDEKAVCEGLWWLALVNVTANVVVNLLVLLLIKRGSALLMQVASGIQLPVVNLFYACRFIMTSQYVTPMVSSQPPPPLQTGIHLDPHSLDLPLSFSLQDLYMWLGLALVTVGFFIYSFLPLGPRVNPNGEELGGKAGTRRSGGRKRNPFLESVPGADTPLMSPAESEKPATTTRLTTHYESRTLQAI